MTLRIVFATLLLTFAFHAGADDKKDEKIDAKLLIGKWEPKDKKLLKYTVVIEYTKDGRHIHTVTGDGPERKTEFTHKVDGNKMTVTYTKEAFQTVFSRTITKLTDTELVTTEQDGVVLKYVRIKEK